MGRRTMVNEFAVLSAAADARKIRDLIDKLNERDHEIVELRNEIDRLTDELAARPSTAGTPTGGSDHGC